MQKNLKNISILVIIILLMVLMTRFNWYTYELKADTPLTDDNLIINRTEQTYLDTLFSKSFELAGIKGQRFVIKEMPIEIQRYFRGYEIVGSVIPKQDYYAIYIKDVGLQGSIDIVAHETMHVVQYVSGDLQSFALKGFVMWKEDLYGLPLMIKYEDIPWESEAFKNAPKLKKRLMGELFYKKWDIYYKSFKNEN